MHKNIVVPQEDIFKQMKKLKKGKKKESPQEAILRNIHEMLTDTKKY